MGWGNTGHHRVSGVYVIFCIYFSILYEFEYVILCVHICIYYAYNFFLLFYLLILSISSHIKLSIKHVTSISFFFHLCFYRVVAKIAGLSDKFKDWGVSEPTQATPLGLLAKAPFLGNLFAEPTFFCYYLFIFLFFVSSFF